MKMPRKPQPISSASMATRSPQIVRGDRLQLSPGESAEVLQSRISYYAGDVAVIGWNAAFLYDSANAGTETAIQLLRVRQLATARVPPLR